MSKYGDNKTEDDMEEKEMEIVYGDDLEKCIYRYSVAGFDMGLEDEDDYIPVIILKQILDHFVPKWRKREDRYYKLKKFATEHQLDTCLNRLREYIDRNRAEIMREIIKMREKTDEYEVKMAEVDRIIEAEKIAIERVRIMQSKENTEE